MSEALSFEQRVQARKRRIKQERRASRRAMLSRLKQVDLADAGRRTSALGRKVTIGLSIPAFLVLLGAVTLPLGIIAWLVAVFMFFGTWKGKKQ